MANLKDYRIPEKVFTLSGGASFAVRGLSLPQITHLVTKYGDEVKRLFSQAHLDGSGLNLAQMESIGNSILLASPDLAADLIAISAGEEEAVDVIKSLPFPVQIEALEAILDLTFDSTGGPKKLLEIVTRLFKGLGSHISDLRQLKSGSLLSEGK